MKTLDMLAVGTIVRVVRLGRTGRIESATLSPSGKTIMYTAYLVRRNRRGEESADMYTLFRDEFDVL